MSFRANECESRNLPKQQVLPCGGSISHVVDFSTPLRCGRNDNFGAFLRIRLLFLQHFTLPCGPHQACPLGRASFPRGKLLYRVGRHTGSFLRRDNRKVPGTAHRPFPTVSLVGGTVQPHGLYMQRSMVVLRAANQNLLIAGGNHTLIPSMNHRRHIA